MILSPAVSSCRYFSYLSKAGDKMRFDLALAASEARWVHTVLHGRVMIHQRLLGAL